MSLVKYAVANGVRARGDSLPAPVKGWNARDPLDGMDPEFAPVLDNWFPQTGYLGSRRGIAAHCSSVGTTSGNTAVESVMAYRGHTTTKFLAAANGKIQNVTTAGAASSLKTGFSNNRFQHVNFNNVMIMVNGEDTPQQYDGSSVTVATYTGTVASLTATSIIAVHVFKNRLLLVEDNDNGFWYLPTSQVTGTAQRFALGEVDPQGGELVAIGTISIDGGSGFDDLAAFIMSSGSVLIYQGTDPGDANAWALVGIYHIGPPVGRRCLVKYGGDLIVITSDGYIPLSGVLQSARTNQALAISDNISGAVSAAVRNFGGNFGWQPIFYPKGNMLLINVPTVEGSQARQHVMNTITGAWCRFKGWDGICFEVHNDELYMGGKDAKVYKADTNRSDGGDLIETEGQTAYKYIGGRGMLKRFTMYRPIIATDGSVTVSVGLGVDFQPTIPVMPQSSVGISAAEWDVASWDVDQWTQGLTINKGWQSANNLGYAASMKVKTKTDSQEVRWYSTNVTYEPGGFV